ncbi:hypothetical protein VQL36_10055 [Chengkuizengella sp. SCS-71B]|uniref:hypothetical protein n=1 Tax=Chengkuizengella sp. SCS-71B TaxID=3115290 RepID=UPI0032C22F50
MKKLYKHKTKWIIGITIFYVILAAYYFLYFQKDMELLELKVEEKTSVQRALEHTAMVVESSKEELSSKSLENYINPEDQLPNLDRVDEMIKTLEALEASTGVSISTIGFNDGKFEINDSSDEDINYLDLLLNQDDKQKQDKQLELQDVIPNLREIDISLQLSGTYFEFIDFLTNIHNDQRFYMVQYIDFQLNKDSTNTDQNDSQLESANINELLTQLDLENLDLVQGENFESLMDANQGEINYTVNLSAYYLPN